MADGMTKGEIEDVLSSIRRLVSDGNRPVFRAAPRPFAREAEKLILTPALRVQPTEDAAPSRFVLTGEVAETAARPPLGSVVTAIAAAVPREVQGWEPETGDPTAPFASSSRAEGWLDGFSARRALSPDGPDRLVHALLTPLDEAEDGAATALPWADAADREGDDGWDVVVPAAAADFTDPFPPQQDIPPPENPDPVAEMPAVDPAMLSAMIRDILREELRGSLGERVTSSLRKLVRAEVARALALRAED